MTMTAEQTRRHHRGIGSSDAAVVLQISPWKSLYELWSEKYHALDGRDDPLRKQKLDERPELKWGNRLEAPIVDAFAEESGIAIARRNTQLAHPSLAFIIASPDAEAVDGCPVEAKTSRSAEGWGEPGSAEIPMYYEPQVQHQLGLMPGAAGAHVAVLIAGSDFRVYFVPRDDQFIHDMYAAEAFFWRAHVETGVPPEPTTVPGFLSRYRYDDGTAIEADPALAMRVADLKELADQAERLAEQQEAVRAEIMGAMREAQALTFGGRPIVTWKTCKGAERFDSKAFGAAHPELYREFVKTGEPYRRFTAK